MGAPVRTVAAALALLGAACADAPPPQFDAAPLEATLKSFVDDGRAVGVSALVYWKGKEAYFGAFGLRDREAGLPMTRDTIVEIQSMTKPITGAAVMQLYEQGRFDLNDPIAKYAPEFANLKVWTGFDESGDMILVDPKRPPSMRDLGRHTAGFYVRGYDSPLRPLVVAANPIDPNNTLAEFAKKLATLPLLFHPGERIVYAYSNDVQAYVVERIAGEPYGDYLQAHVLAPLGLKDTGYYVPEEKRARFAAAYSPGAGGSLKREPGESGNFRHWPLTPGGHGLTSTLDDYMRFALMIQNDGEIGGVRLLKPETVRLMGTDQLPAAIDRTWPSPAGDIGWGINFAVRTAPPASAEAMFGVVGEMFWEGALGTLFWIDPENDLTAVFFVQQQPPVDSLHKDFRNAVYAGIGLGFAHSAPSP